MGPSVKFVSAHRSISKKNGGQFFSLKKTILGGGGSKGGLEKDYTFLTFFLEPFPKPIFTAHLLTYLLGPDKM